MNYEDINTYDYDLDESLIAQTPIKDRDHSRLLVVDKTNGKMVDETFYNIINYLKGYGINVFVYDPVADRNETYKSYNIELVDYDEINNVDAIVVAVAHDEFKNISLDELEKKYVDDRKTLVDLKGIYNKKDVEDRGITYWRL